MNLQAIALRRAEEQVANLDNLDDKPKRRPPAFLRRGNGGNPVTCDCGECRTCRNRDAMRRRRAGLITIGSPTCARCGGRRYRKADVVPFCFRCQNDAPKAYRAAVRAYFTHGGGI